MDIEDAKEFVNCLAGKSHNLIPPTEQLREAYEALASHLGRRDDAIDSVLYPKGKKACTTIDKLFLSSISAFYQSSVFASSQAVSTHRPQL